MKNLAYYRQEEIKDDLERYDPNDGLESIKQIATGSHMWLKDKNTGDYKNIATINKGLCRIKNSNLDMVNVYCMFYLSIPDSVKQTFLDEYIDKRLLKPSDNWNTAIIIYDPQEFVTRVKDKANEKGLSHDRKLVEYKDLSSFSGEVGPFIKGLEYQHQSELRIVVFDKSVSNLDGKDKKLHIGSIEDIALKVDLSDLGKFCINEVN